MLKAGAFSALSLAPYLCFMLDFLALSSKTKKPYTVLKKKSKEQRGKEIKEGKMCGIERYWKYKKDSFQSWFLLLSGHFCKGFKGGQRNHTTNY